MTGDWPKIRARRTTKISPWMDVTERDVEFSPGDAAQTYHAIAQADYIAIVGLTADGRVPIVRQYRPAVEAFTWELPAGLVDAGEDSAEACRRELMEETGYSARAIHALGEAWPCTGRMSNRIHSFFVELGARDESAKPEAGLSCTLVSCPELVRMIKAGEFASQLHIGAVLLAELHGFLKLPTSPDR